MQNGPRDAGAVLHSRDHDAHVVYVRITWYGAPWFGMPGA